MRSTFPPCLIIVPSASSRWWHETPPFYLVKQSLNQSVPWSGHLSLEDQSGKKKPYLFRTLQFVVRFTFIQIYKAVFIVFFRSFVSVVERGEKLNYKAIINHRLGFGVLRKTSLEESNYTQWLSFHVINLYVMERNKSLITT